MDRSTQVLLADFGTFFAEHPDCVEIHSGPFTLWFNLKHRRLNDAQRAVYGKRLRQIDRAVDAVVEGGLMQRLLDATTAAQLTAMLEQYQDGELDLTTALRGIHERHQEQTTHKGTAPEVLDDISSLLTDDQGNTGLGWRLGALADSMRALQEGDFVVFAARPDAGKTTWLASELTHMAPQVDKLYPGEHRSILWFNNEGPGRRIKRRLFQSALGLKTSELYALAQQGALQAAYARAVGRSDVIRVFDIHGFRSHEVEDILAVTPAALVVFDMIDNIKFDGAQVNSGQRTDQALEAMYQWARVMAVRHSTRVLATSQVSAAGEGQPYPDMSMLKDSKTGKQGAADAIVILGKSNAPELRNTRFVGIPKNKLHREGGPRDPQREVVFDGGRARVKDAS